MLITHRFVSTNSTWLFNNDRMTVMRLPNSQHDFSPVAAGIEMTYDRGQISYPVAHTDLYRFAIVVGNEVHYSGLGEFK